MKNKKDENIVKNNKNKIIEYIKNNKKRCLIILISTIVVIGIITMIIKKINGDDISKVSKVLPQKFYEIECMDSDCSGIIAYKESKKGKSKVVLLDGFGKEVAKYKTTYDSKAKTIKVPSSLGKDFFIFKKTNVSSAKVTGYSIANKKGKEVYSTDKTLKAIGNYLVLMTDTKKGLNGYSILNSKGKKLYKNINDYEVYSDGKVISAEIDGNKEIIDEKGEIILSGYSVATEITNKDGKSAYLLVENSKDDTYHYFSLKSLKIVGDSFQNYSRNADGTLTIAKKENNSTVKYELREDGKQVRIGDSETQSQLADTLRKTVDTKKYNLYLTSVYDKNQKYVFADDLTKKTFGLYNIKSKKFQKIFSYKTGTSNLYASISKLSNDNDLNYYQVSCSAYNCEKNEFYIYDLDNGKSLYELSDSKLKIQGYYQYEDNYKVVKYSYSSSNNEYKGKYVLYGKDNKEILKNTNPITIVDKKLLVGNEISLSLILYSTKDKKTLNSDRSLASRISVQSKVYYRYQNDNDTILLDEKGKEVLKISSSSNLIYSDKLIVYVKDGKAYMFNAITGKTKKYKFKTNEKMNDASGDLISPYRGVIFINNSADNRIKVVNSKGNIIKKIKKAEIENVYKTDDNNVIIITKDDSKKTPVYGLYIAK